MTPAYDAFDDMLDEVEDLGTQMSSPDLAALLEKRADDMPPAAFGRAAWFSLAGERWQMAGDLTRARSCYERAIVDGGETYLDPRADLADVLLDLGDVERAEELVEELRRDSRAGSTDPFLHEHVGEILELHERYDEALRWFNIGLSQQEDRDEDLDIGCLNGHYRVRRALGLPFDRYDQLSEEARRAHGRELRGESPLAGGATTRTEAALAVIYWPPEELDLLLRRWPQLADAYGDEHAQHRSLVEQRLRALSADHPRVGVAFGVVAEYVGFAEEHGHDGADSSTRAFYAAHLHQIGRTTPWPPGRNEPCWCGSAKKYKKCCGGLRFAEEELSGD
jgi:tetratricopeptide (TPR) repeat protein